LCLAANIVAHKFCRDFVDSVVHARSVGRLGRQEAAQRGGRDPVARLADTPVLGLSPGRRPPSVLRAWCRPDSPHMCVFCSQICGGHQSCVVVNGEGGGGRGNNESQSGRHCAGLTPAPYPCLWSRLHPYTGPISLLQHIVCRPRRGEPGRRGGGEPWKRGGVEGVELSI
jgi:hypothetical protein